MNIDRLTQEVTSLIRGKNISTPFPIRGEGLLLALSGGADSVALLRALLALGYKVEAAHCNFHLRGEESDRDEAFCKNLCDSLSVPLHLAHFDTKVYADLHGVSIEMAARTLRYDYFFKLVDDLGLDGVCVAHHRDDSVETVLLNMVRGTGMEGLRGIASQNGKVIRPMLNVSRTEIINYLSKLNQDFIIDSSNLVDDVQRNKMRLNVIPELLSINPAAVENVHKLSSRVQDALLILNSAIDNTFARLVKVGGDGVVSIDIQSLLREPGTETLLWYLLKDKDFSSLQTEQIFERIKQDTDKSGREWSSSFHTLLIDRGAILIQKNDTPPTPEVRIPETGTYIYGDGSKFRFSIVDVDENFEISREPNKVCLDADKVNFPLAIRTVKTADWFVPFGMKGKKLVSDFLTDRKFSLFEKRRQLAIVQSDGNILWLVGLRPDGRFCITESSKRALVIEKSDLQPTP